MGAFDLVERTIHHESWGEGEEVVIRELTYGETTKITKSCTGDDGELDEHKLADTMLTIGIVSWTFSKNGEVAKVNLATIRDLPTNYITFIAKELGEFAVDIDDDFQGETATIP